MVSFNGPTDKQWQPNSWRLFNARQQPNYSDQSQLFAVEQSLSKMPPLVFVDEVKQLRSQLALASSGKAFLLQGGDCAETFADFSADGIRDLFKVLMQMSVVLTYAGRKPVVKVGRLAGQFAKPRSAAVEQQAGITLASFRGDIINGVAFTEQARQADPQRMIQAYHQSTATLNLLRSFAKGGLADLHQVNEWNLSFVSGNAACEQYAQLASQIQDALEFMEVCGITSESTPALKETTLYTSHEALLLNYEQSLTRAETPQNSSLEGQAIQQQWFDCSAHMLWVGERTRQPDGAHIEFLRGIENPIGIKLSHNIRPDELIDLLDRLNPNNSAGKIVLISRMGADHTAQYLPPLVERVNQEGRSLVWSCDPMHGNTIKAAGGIKTRSFDSIIDEVEQFFAVLPAYGEHAGGLHLEMTGAHVTECVGGAYHVSEADLASRYKTQCDPRLNAEQVLELSFIVAKLMRGAS